MSVRLGQLNRIIFCELQLLLQKVCVEIEYTTILLNKTNALSGDKMAIDLEKKMNNIRKGCK